MAITMKFNDFIYICSSILNFFSFKQNIVKRFLMREVTSKCVSYKEYRQTEKNIFYFESPNVRTL